jgi:hypothetical protein
VDYNVFNVLQILDDFRRLYADWAHAAQQVYDVLFVIGEAVGVEPLADGEVLGRALLLGTLRPEGFGKPFGSLSLRASGYGSACAGKEMADYAPTSRRWSWSAVVGWCMRTVFSLIG